MGKLPIDLKPETIKKLQAPCPECYGTGIIEVPEPKHFTRIANKPCPSCAGTGEVRECPDCHGTGNYHQIGITFICPTCLGEGVIGGGENG